MITYPINTEETKGRWVLYDTNTSTYAKMSGGTGNWPNGEGTEIQGLDANLVPMLLVTSAKPANIDERFSRLVGSEQAPDFANSEIRTTWAIVGRSKEEKADVVRNVEYQEANKHIDVTRELLETRIVVAALLRTVKNLNVPTALQTFADEYLGKAEKLYANRGKIKALLAQVEAGQNPDIDGTTFEAP